MVTVRRFIYTFLVSMIPAIEIKGAIPFGIALGLDAHIAFFAGLAGSSVIVCFLAFFTNWFYRFCKRKHLFKRFIGWMDKITNKHSQRIQSLGSLAIFAYVAVPIPGTGTWTGSIIAGVFNMKPRNIILSVFCGNIVSGLIVSLVGNEVISMIRMI